VIGIYDATGHRLGFNDDISSNNTDSRTSVSLQAGQQYYFGVTNWSGSSVRGSYTWSINGPNVLHQVGVTADGHLWHAIRNQHGSWVGVGDVESQAGDRGAFTSVDSTVISGQLHVVGVTSDGHLWHTIRHLDGTWSGFGDVEGEAGDRGAFVRVSVA